MKHPLKPLAACLAAMFGATSFNVWGAPPVSPPAQTQSGGAQPETDVPSPTASPVLAAPPRTTVFPPQPKEFPGIAWGSFLAFPDVTLSVTHDDNIYALRSQPVDDVVYTLSPSLALKSNWKEHGLNFDLGGDFDRYRTHSDENVNDWWAGFDGHYDFNPATNLFGGFRHSYDHEDRSAPGSLAVQVKPTRYDHDEAHLGVSHESGAFRLRVGGTWDRYDYHDGFLPSGVTVDQDYRDRDMSSFGVRAGYVLSPSYEVFGQYATDVRSYANLIPTQTFNRDSDGYRAAAGVRFTLQPQRLAGEAFAGMLRQHFDYSGFSDVSVPYFGALATWKPTSQTTVTGFIDRSLEETNVFDSTGYASSSTDTTYGFEVERRLTSQWSMTGRAAYTRSDFNNIDRLDKIIDAGAGLHYYVTPTVYVGGDLRIIDRNSNSLRDQYSNNQVMLSVGYTPARSRDYSIIPEQEAGAAEAPRAQGLYSGFYLGAQLGYGALTAHTSGQRGEGEGTDTADMGGFGAGYGAFGGWGTEFDNWYVGVELDAGNSDASWSHSKAKADSVTEFVDEDSHYGVSLRVGYVLDGGMLYGRLGAVETDFHTYFAENQFASTGGFDQSHSETGTRIGVGLEIPASRNLFVRTDYSVTHYDGYAAVHQVSASGTTTSENIGDPQSDVFSLGVGYRFGGEGPAIAARPATTLRGLYAGASAGYGTTGTELTGTQMDSGGAQGPFAFTGDFANAGYTGGFFAGYGTTWNQVYAGLEIEAEASNYGWYHTRTNPSGGGRNFSVEKRGNYGGGLRIGYVLDNGSLLYTRVGVVEARFNTAYAKGNNPDSWIDRTDTQSGTRYGIGAEIPASENAFVRMEYDYVKYDSYSLATAQGGGSNVDAMNFSNRESLARLGLGFRF